MDVRFLGFFACLPASQWNMEEQMPTLESDRPGLEYQLQHLSMCPGASPSTFLNLRVFTCQLETAIPSLKACSGKSIAGSLAHSRSSIDGSFLLSPVFTS